MLLEAMLVDKCFVIEGKNIWKTDKIFLVGFSPHFMKFIINTWVLEFNPVVWAVFFSPVQANYAFNAVHNVGTSRMGKNIEQCTRDATYFQADITDMCM